MANSEAVEYYNETSRKVCMNYRRHALLIIIIGLIGISGISFSLHYSGEWRGNLVAWVSWVLAAVAFFFMQSSGWHEVYSWVRRIKRIDVFLIFFITCLYFVSHLVNFHGAPWNQFGLFDDAAWDIYYARNHVFNNTVLQPAFFDSVGQISREIVFHYYISTWFLLFGANLLVFNVSLLFLGYITVVYTTMLIHRLFRQLPITLLSLCILNFFPLHFTHVFMGHRYAIAAPLMMVSLYYLYTGWKEQSAVRMVVSAFFAVACWDSAIMGKQYLYGLMVSGGLMSIFLRKQLAGRMHILLIWCVSFLIAALPLVYYIVWNYRVYAARENGLFLEFMEKGVQPYLAQLYDVFFAVKTYKRQFLIDFPSIPFAYYVMVVPGLLIAWIRRQYIWVLLAVIPVVGAFISGAYDFRVVLAVPFWVIGMAWTMREVYRLLPVWAATIGIVFVLGFGFVPSVQYLWQVTHDPNHIYLLPHKDVAVSRMVADIVRGESRPSIQMKQNEFGSIRDDSVLPYDTFVCPESAYAIMHVYLQAYDDRQILSFCDGGISKLMTSGEVLQHNKEAVKKYKRDRRDLVLLWEVSPASDPAIAYFRSIAPSAKETTFQGSVDGHAFSLLMLRIPAPDIARLQQNVLTL